MLKFYSVTTLRKTFLFALVALPLQSGSPWHLLPYGDIGPNVVSFGKTGLTMAVQKTASPAIYLFNGNREIYAVHATGTVTGLPQVPPGKVEGGNGYDDFPVRVGFAEEGKSRMTAFDQWLAPGWLNQILDLDPDHKLARVYFLNLAQQRPIGEFRLNPRNKLFEEEIVGNVRVAGEFTVDHTFNPPLTAFGLWLESDGDDTHSTFDVTYRTLSLDIGTSKL
jgi:hypothetical protein